MAKNGKFQTGNVLLISISHLLHDVYSSFLAPILPLLIAKHGMSMFLAGSLSVFQRIPNLFNPFIGILAEKVKARYFVILTPAITAISMSLIGVAPHYIYIILLLFIAGLSAAFYHVPTPVMLKKISGKKLGLGMSLYMFGGEIARTLAPVVILGAVSLWGLEGSYKLIPFGVITSGIVFMRLRHIEIRSDFSKKKNKVNYKKIFRQFVPMFVSLAGFTFFFGAMKSALTLYLPTYLNFSGSSLWISGISLSILQLSGAVGALFSGPLSDKIGKKTILVIIVLVAPVLMWLFINAKGGWIFPLLILLGVFVVASTPVILSIVNSAKTEHTVFINGVHMGISFLLNAIMVMLVGWAMDHIGMQASFKLSAGIALLAIPFILMLPKGAKY